MTVCLYNQHGLVDLKNLFRCAFPYTGGIEPMRFVKFPGPPVEFCQTAGACFNRQSGFFQGKEHFKALGKEVEFAVTNAFEDFSGKYV